MPDGAVTKASLLLEEYKTLSEGLHKHQTFIYSVMPGMLTVLGALLAFTATKELPQSQIQWFWLAGAVAIALAYAWTAMSHSVACLLATQLVAVEKKLNAMVGGGGQTLTFNQVASADGLGAAPNMRVFLAFANLPLLCFVGVGAYRSYEGGEPWIYWPVWCAAAICLACTVLTGKNSRSARAQCRAQPTERQAMPVGAAALE